MDRPNSRGLHDGVRIYLFRINRSLNGSGHTCDCFAGDLLARPDLYRLPSHPTWKSFAWGSPVLGTIEKTRLLPVSSG